jgi:hypothetical protein
MSTPEGVFLRCLGRVQLGGVGAAPGHDRGAAPGAERHGILDGLSAAEPEGQAGGEAVAAAVGVDDGARHGRWPKWTPWLDPAAEGA